MGYIRGSGHRPDDLHDVPLIASIGAEVKNSRTPARPAGCMLSYATPPRRVGQRGAAQVCNWYSATCRRGDRIELVFAAVHESESGTFATCRVGLTMSVVRG